MFYCDNLKSPQNYASNSQNRMVKPLVYENLTLEQFANFICIFKFWLL